MGQNTHDMEAGISKTRMNPDSGERFQALRRELGVSSFGLNQIVLEPGQRGRVHRHREQEEVYIVLEGRLSVLVEGEEHALEHGELMRVGPGVRRQLVNYGPERVVMLALGGAGEHVGRDGEAFSSWEAESGSPPQETPLPDDLDPSELRS
jgi:mannose-6-phosphate isomerase-like protein (cupin superfamily)